jgi:hypothetical protein
MLAEVAEENIEKGNLTALPELAREYAEDNAGARVVIVDRDGQVLTGSAGTTVTGTALAGEPDIAAALRNETTVATRTGTDGADILAATMPGSSGTTIRGALRVTYTMTMVTDREHRIWTALALAGACILAAAALVAFTLACWITRPLRTLERATTQLAAGSVGDGVVFDVHHKPQGAGSGAGRLDGQDEHRGGVGVVLEGVDKVLTAGRRGARQVPALCEPCSTREPAWPLAAVGRNLWLKFRAMSNARKFCPLCVRACTRMRCSATGTASGSWRFHVCRHGPAAGVRSPESLAPRVSSRAGSL